MVRRGNRLCNEHFGEHAADDRSSLSRHPEIHVLQYRSNLKPQSIPVAGSACKAGHRPHVRQPRRKVHLIGSNWLIGPRKQILEKRNRFAVNLLVSARVAGCRQRKKADDLAVVTRHVSPPAFKSLEACIGRGFIVRNTVHIRSIGTLQHPIRESNSAAHEHRLVIVRRYSEARNEQVKTGVPDCRNREYTDSKVEIEYVAGYPPCCDQGTAGGALQTRRHHDRRAITSEKKRHFD